VAIVEFEVFRDYLGVGATDPEVDDVSRLYDAIGSEIKRITRRDFEGDEGGSYTEIIRLHGAQEFTLEHVPVESVESIAKHNFDGTDEDPYEADRWRLEDAERGRIRLLPSPEYVTVAYTTTGAIPAQVPQAYLEWGHDRWNDGELRPAGLASYQTGEDAESYSVTLAGRPSRTVLLALLGVAHVTGGGVV
jgi:hypothetical protein